MRGAEEDFFFDCPYCGSSIPLRVDRTGGRRQSFTHDCEVCCRPILVNLAVGHEGVEDFDAAPES